MSKPPYQDLPTTETFGLRAELEWEQLQGRSRHWIVRNARDMDAHERCEDVLQDPEDGEVCSFSCESSVADIHLIAMPQYQVPIYLTLFMC